MEDYYRFSHGWACRAPPPAPPTPTLNSEELTSLQDEYLADDRDLDLGLMTQWTEVQARAFFESGGSEIPILPPEYVDIPTLLREAGLEAIGEEICADSMELWVERFNHSDGRNALLQRLKYLGVERVGQRQAFGNAFQRAWRSGRVPPPTPQQAPLDPPSALLQRAAEHVASIRLLSSEDKQQRLLQVGCRGGARGTP